LKTSISGTNQMKIADMPKSSTLCQYHKKICLITLSTSNSGQKYNFLKSYKWKINKNPNCNHNSSNLCY